MNFVSQEFLVFMALVLGVYFLLSHAWQNILLLVGSYVFYGWWDWRFLSLLLVSSIVDFFCGLALDLQRNGHFSQRKRKFILSFSILVNLGLLGTFKYFNFFSQSFLKVMEQIGIQCHPLLLKVVLPIGISFYTFQTMSYTIDIYRGKLRSTSKILDFMLYVSFFPQLVAGPIERATHLLPQILNNRKVTWERFCSGCQLAFWGFYKKVVIADNMAVIADTLSDTEKNSIIPVILAVYAFAFQIYGDFSGYTDIARGVARILGFDICTNFRLPYCSTNPSDFWQRWHISLSTWLRDYLYIPLGGNRKGKWNTVRNLQITMLLGGLWHGAAMRFILWGAYHGILLSLFRIFGHGKKAKAKTFEIRRGFRFWLSVILYFQLTCLGWFLFRYCRIPLSLTWGSFPIYETSLFLLIVVPFVAFQIYQYYSQKNEPWQFFPAYIRVPFYLFIFYSLVFLGSPNRYEFVYFQF